MGWGRDGGMGWIGMAGCIDGWGRDGGLDRWVGQ